MAFRCLSTAIFLLSCWCYAEHCLLDPRTGLCANLDHDGGHEAFAATTVRKNTTTAAPGTPENACTVYMAKSTIPGAGLGIFSGVDRQPGEIIGNGDVMIPVPDIWLHLRALGDEFENRDDYFHINPLADFVWLGTELGMQRESSYTIIGETEYIWGYAPGLDAAINCHQGLNNVEKGAPDFSVVGLHRSKDPGAGAFTPYYGCSKYWCTGSLVHGGAILEIADILLCVTLKCQKLRRQHTLYLQVVSFSKTMVKAGSSLERLAWDLYHSTTTIPTPKKC